MPCKVKLFAFLTDYVKELMEELIRCRHNNPTIPQALAIEKEREIPGPLTNNVEKIDKETAIQQQHQDLTNKYAALGLTYSYIS